MKRRETGCELLGGAAPAGGTEPDFLETLRSAPLSELGARLVSLTPQERSILDLIVRGHCNKDICRTLGIEVTTTKVHASRIFKKLGVKNRVQAAVLQLWTLLLSNGMADPVRDGAGTMRRPRVVQRDTHIEARQ